MQVVYKIPKFSCSCLGETIAVKTEELVPKELFDILREATCSFVGELASPELLGRASYAVNIKLIELVLMGKLYKNYDGVWVLAKKEGENK